MKKILLAVLLSFAVTSGFAVAKTYDSLGFHFATPFMFEFSNNSGVKSTGTTSSLAFGIHATTLYSEKMGIYAGLDVMFPLSISTYQTNGIETYSNTVTRDSYRSLWGMSFLMGPAIAVSRSEKAMFVISPGVHFYMLNAVAAASVSSYVFGIGANFQYNLFFSSRGYFNVGGDVAFDLFGWALLNGRSYSVKSVTLSITPRIGIGFRFN